MAGVSFKPYQYQPRPEDLAGRVIAITGPTRGIGRAVALACAQHGAQVILLGRQQSRLEAVHAEITKAQGDATIAVLDLEKAIAADYDTLADAIVARFGRLDGLLHNAAILGTLAPIEHYDVPTWCRVMHVNLTALFALTQVLLPALKQSADAAILCTTSSVAQQGRAFWGGYSVAKAGVENFVQVLAAELENTSCIRVNALNPGATRTAMRQQAFPAEDPRTLKSPQEIVPAYLALLGAASRGVSGQSFLARAPAD